MDGELVDWADATVHVLTHTLHYGSGVFEGIRAYPTERGVAVFRLPDHIERLFVSAKVFMIDVPFTVDELVEATKDVVRVNGLDDGCYIRPIVYLGYGEMGLNPLPCPVNVSIAAWPWGTYLGDEGVANGVRRRSARGSATTPTPCPRRPRGPACTSTRRWPRSRPSRPATTRPSSSAPTATSASARARTSSSSGRAASSRRPSSDSGALEGITQDSVETIARDLGYEVVTEPLIRTDLYTADEAFLTGTAAEVVPIREVDDRPVGTASPGRSPSRSSRPTSPPSAARSTSTRTGSKCRVTDPPSTTTRPSGRGHAVRPRPHPRQRGPATPTADPGPAGPRPRPGDPGQRPATGAGHDFDLPALPEAVDIFDTTLRDGSQQEGLSLTVDDKLRVAEQLDHLGVTFIEGGWPGANPKDEEFFARAPAELSLARPRWWPSGPPAGPGCGPRTTRSCATW